ncbi:MAG: chromosome segregation protein SMC [Burkholderiaceae bacterium]|nr:MAG: chromosome segregation protein SMC [Burkholderiaceae bacterium]
MRLTQIKLAGFKSFVDPTHFEIPSQLVGVVGPNGCGKSNIIDAVRWVLGESKASELRGESMQDVIFNGSTLRKPSGRSSVELIFDNAAGRAAGQWSQYAEIAVKRVLTRDGTSSYYINNQQVRRRDIQDIFMGTGLGPRAYAIIGQGMISRIIEAKPEELRIFLEEAAGVSKYKERRRETENRLSDTRENLTRLDDILRELNSQIEKLEGQAVVAQQYRALQSEVDDKQKLLWLMRRNEAQAEQEKVLRDVGAAQNKLEEQTAQLRALEADLEQLRSAQYAGSDSLHTAQGKLYEANTEVTRLEGEIRNVVDARNRIQQQLATLTAQVAHWAELGEQAQAEQTTAEENLAVAEERAAIAQEESVRAQDSIPDLEQAQRNAQEQKNAAHRDVLQTEQAIQLAASQQGNAGRSLQNLMLRKERLTQEQGGLQRPDEAQLETLRVQQAETEAALSQAQTELENCQQQVPALEAARNAAQEKLSAEQNQAGQSEARLQALKQLQENVQSQGKLNPWLEKHELAKLPRLWQRLHIEAGWETALEAVLREWMNGLEVSQLDWVKAFFNDAPPARLAMFTPPLPAPAAAPAAGLRPLLSLLQITDASLRALLDEWLAQVYVADDAAQALAQRNQLPPGARFVVKGGHQVLRNGVVFYAPDSEQAGMLARQQEIENLIKQCRAQALQTEEAKGAAIRAEAQLTQAQQQLNTVRQRVAEITARQHGSQMELLKLTQAHERYLQSSGRISEELAEIQMHEEELRAQQTDAEASFERLDAELGEKQEREATLQMALEDAEQRVQQARDQWRDKERAAQEARFAQQTARNRIEELKRTITTSQQQQQQVRAAIAGNEAELQKQDDAAAQSGLQQALEIKVAAEEALARARTELDDLNQKLRSAEEQRLQQERALEPLRERITNLQLKEQAARLNAEQYDQQLAEAQANIEHLLTLLTEGTKPNWLQSEVNRIHQEIAALGAVNLAALDELTQSRERKGFLDAQEADLKEAMTTLEDAIRKIDLETRELLKQTFDTVNQHFGELFPILFGGGDAKLMMTGEEILDAGVQVMAQPPGKKNSTIHLLSGGEKALTATALVFALFQLNPAPFCLLDEVDAPLDDANTERFCNMVKRMSGQTQFLFISHNKIAMEMAQQLIGVTMQEQGVSRIVAVDIESAAKLTAEAA